ncbi:MAG: hypothetical protein JWQ35_194, partial [Bacteriovoracaceae bacterium]|nr:hypothetical protein [Bacteriovoracaceae bacterium]
LPEISAEMESYQVIFVHGAPLFGKTSLFQQLREHIELQTKRTVFSIEFRHDIDLGFALQKIAQLFEISVQKDEPQSAILDLQDQILQILEKNSFCLMIDNFDRIRSFEPFLEFLVRNLRSGKVIASGGHVPKIDPALTMDFRIHTHAGLTEKEIEQLIQQCRVTSQTDTTHSLAHKLFKITSGNPYLVKLILSPAILENRLLNDSDFQNNIEHAKTHYLKKVYDSFGDSIQSILIKASLLRYSELFESKFLNQLGSSVLNRLMNTGFISQNLETFRLTSDFKNFLNGSVNLEKFRREICKELQNETGYEEQKEIIFQLTEMKQFERAAKYFDVIMPEMRHRGESTDITELSESLKQIISIESFEARAMALRFLEKQQTLKNDTQFRLTITKDKTEMARLYLSMAITSGSLGETTESVSYAERSMEYCDPSSAIFIESLLVKANYKAFEDTPGALALVQKAEALIAKLRDDPSDELFARLHMAYWRCLNTLGDFKQCENHAFSAKLYFSKSKNNIRELWSGINLAIARYNSGLISQSLSDTQHLLNMSEHFRLKMIRRTCLDVQARHFAYQGRLKNAEALWAKTDAWDTIKELTMVDQWGVWQSLVWAKPKTGLFTESLSMLNKFLTFDLTKRNTRWIFLAEEMQCSLENVLVKNFENIIRPIPELSLKTLTFEDRVFIKNFQLELHWMNFAPKELGRALDFPASESPTHVSVPYKMVYRSLSGLHYLMEGQIKRAEDLLGSCVQFFRESEYFIWELRTLLGLSIIDLHFGRLSNALGRLSRAEVLVKEIDPCNEIDLFLALHALAHLKDGKQSQFEMCLNQIEGNSPYKYFHQILAPYKTSKTSVSFSSGVEPHQRKFFDRIISLIGFDFLNRVTVQSRQGVSTYFTSKIPSSLEKNNLLVFDKIKNLVRIGKWFMPLEGKDVLGFLLKFFIDHPTKLFSKEELTIHVWHEQYNPLVHDTRIYTSIRRLRNLIDPKLNTDLIETNHGSYGLSKEVDYVILSSEQSVHTLSERQEWILKYIETNGSIDRLTAQKLLKISRTPMMNEIKGLISRGLVRSIAKGKLTKYQKATI